jgi:hypothetical protein
MEFKGFEEKKKTPKLGGYFGDLILWIKPNLAIEKQKRFKQYAKSRFNPETRKEDLFFDTVKAADSYLQLVADHIVGWENLTNEGKPTPFSENMRNHFFINLQDQKTGHELELRKIAKEGEPETDETEKRIATLSEYVNWFMNEIENYTKN